VARHVGLKRDGRGARGITLAEIVVAHTFVSL